VQVYAIIDDRSSPGHPLGEAVEVFIRREDADRFIEEVHGDEAKLAGYVRIELRELRLASVPGGCPLMSADSSGRLACV
jgi:hypothetical protein